MIYCKKIEKKIFFKGGTLWCRNGRKKNFRFSKFQNFFLKNGFNGTWQMLIETNSWNLSSFWASVEKSREIICQGGSIWPPPCRIGLSHMHLKMIFLNPILHGGGGSKRPPLADYLSWFLGGCSKWAQISWLCFYQYLPRPIEAIFQKKILKIWKTKFFFSTVPTSKGPPFEIFFLKIIFFHFFSNKSYFFNLNLHFTCSELSFWVI